MNSRVLLAVPVLGAFILGFLVARPIAKAVETLAATNCHGQSACVSGANTGQGAGVQGSSKSGQGVIGSTTFVSTNSKSKAGVFGQDSSSSGRNDMGVWGKSPRGFGVKGTSNTGLGVAGYSNITGVFGQVAGTQSTPTGVYGVDNTQNTNGAGVAGQSNVGTGVIASTLGTKNTTQGLIAAAPNGGLVFVGVGPGNYEIAQLDGSGNLVISGDIFTSGQCSSGCMRNRRVREYGSAAASPLLEDTGEAQLSNGTAYVRLDPAFANAIDPHQGYYVLITPESETRGLYVAQRTLSGFTVRENAAGRTNGSFAYRIEAHPYGSHAQRLPFVQQRQVSMPAPIAPVSNGE